MKHILIASLLLLLGSCSLLNSSKENELGLSKKDHKKVAILTNLGHKNNSLFSEGTYTNSFESVIIALENSKGAQIDIQISKDSTLWLFGENKLRECKFHEFKSLHEFSDEQIEIASVCWYDKQLIQLDRFVHLMDSMDYSDKVLSFELQSIAEPSAVKYFGGEKPLTALLAKKLQPLKRLKNTTILVELPSQESIATFKQYSDFPPYLRLNLKSKVSAFQNLSIPIQSLDQFDLSKLGETQVWGVNSANQFLSAMHSKVSIVQADDWKMAAFFHKNNHFTTTPLVAKKQAIDSDTLFSAKITADQMKDDFLLQLSTKQIKQLGNATLILRGTNENGQEVLWKGYSMNNNQSTYWYYINAEDMQERACKQLMVYIWDQTFTESQVGEFELKKLSH